MRRVSPIPRRLLFSGAQTELSGIPQRFLDGLDNNKELLQLTDRLAEQIIGEG
jgi:hypothetical protein